jgi:hypothetical protein
MVVGWRAELEAIDRSLDALMAGHPGVVEITGEAGIGSEFERDIRTHYSEPLVRAQIALGIFRRRPAGSSRPMTRRRAAQNWAPVSPRRCERARSCSWREGTPPERPTARSRLLLSPTRRASRASALARARREAL